MGEVGLTCQWSTNSAIVDKSGANSSYPETLLITASRPISESAQHNKSQIMELHEMLNT